LALLPLELLGNRPAHAYLLTGPDQARLGQAVLQLAQALNCQDLLADGPCGRCRACDEIARGVFADVSVAAQPTLKLSEVKTRLAMAAERPLVGRRRVVVLDGVPQMSREAQNALLKTLEEPPRGSVLILTALRTDGILPTVLSRCRTLQVPAAGRGAIADSLEPPSGDARDRLFAALAAGDDSVAAQAFAARDDLPNLRADAVQFIAGAIGTRRLPPLELVARHEGRLGGNEAANIWFGCVSAALQGIIAKAAGRGGDIAAAFGPGEWHELGAIEALAAARLAVLLQAVRRAVDSHASARLALEAALLSLDDEGV